MGELLLTAKCSTDAIESAEREVSRQLAHPWFVMTRGSTRVAELLATVKPKEEEWLLGQLLFDEIFSGKSRRHWVNNVTPKADFSRLPENPTIFELSAFALLIDGYGLVKRLEGTGDSDGIDRFNEVSSAPNMSARSYGLPLGAARSANLLRPCSSSKGRGGVTDATRLVASAIRRGTEPLMIRWRGISGLCSAVSYRVERKGCDLSHTFRSAIRAHYASPFLEKKHHSPQP
jgi:hypothetical protein